MPKFYELVVVALIVSLAGSMVFENIKDKYMTLSKNARLSLILVGLLAAGLTIYFGENLPTFQGREIVVPFPIPTVKETSFAIKNPLVQSVVFGFLLSLFAVGSAIGKIREQVSESEVGLNYYKKSPLLVIPMSAFAYKLFVEGGVNGQTSKFMNYLLLTSIIYAAALKHSSFFTIKIRGFIFTLLFLSLSAISTIVALV